MNLKKTAVGFFLVVCFTAGSYYYLDQPIALFVKDVFLSGREQTLFSANIFDALLPMVFIIAAIAWVLYFRDKRHGAFGIRTAFSLLVGTSLPIAFVLKSLLKFLFGGIATRFWLACNVVREFHWFHGVDAYVGFPSGHMIVFTVLLMDLGKYYPRYRWACAGSLFLLALALIVTDYHFLSDVIAGTYFGGLIHFGTDHSLALLHKSGINDRK